MGSFSFQPGHSKVSKQRKCKLVKLNCLDWIMFQRYALRGLLLFVVTSYLVKAEVLVDDDIEAVVIQADANSGSDSTGRVRRQLGFPFQNFGVAASRSRACMSAKGVAGVCAKYAQCYPYYFTSSNTPSWAFGSADACNYADEKTSYQGTCCVTSHAQTLRRVALPWGSPQQWNQGQWRAPAQRQWGAPAQMPQSQWGLPAGVYPQQGGSTFGPQYPQQGIQGLYPGGGMPGGLYPGGGI